MADEGKNLGNTWTWPANCSHTMITKVERSDLVTRCGSDSAANSSARRMCWSTSAPIALGSGYTRLQLLGFHRSCRYHVLHGHKSRQKKGDPSLTA